MYYAFEIEKEGARAMSFLPLEDNCSMARALYNPYIKKLILESKILRPQLKLVDKVDEFGNNVMQKGKQVYERRMIEEPISFYLSEESGKEWIEGNVTNAKYALDKITEYEEIADRQSSSNGDGEQAVPNTEVAVEG